MKAQASETVVSKFDPVTGAVDTSELRFADDSRTQLTIEEGHKLQKMTETDGWKHLEGWMMDVIEGLKEKLVDCDDFQKIKSYQAAIRSYSNVIGYVTFKISDGETLRQQILDDETPS